AAGSKEKVIPTSCPTRWNSAYEQAVAINANKLQIQQLCVWLKAEGKVDVNYNQDDWDNTSAVIEVLALFARATKVLQGDSFITNSMMAMLGSQMHVFCLLKATTMSLPPHIRAAADKMFDNFGGRFEK
ncbi:unnamed protein product, partial [Scytosiphon promiscuus]